MIGSSIISRRSSVSTYYDVALLYLIARKLITARMYSNMNESMYKVFNDLLAKIVEDFDDEVLQLNMRGQLDTSKLSLLGDCRCTLQLASNIVNRVVENYDILENAYFLDDFGDGYFKGVDEIMQLMTRPSELAKPTVMSNLYHMLHRVRSGLTKLNCFISNYEAYSNERSASAFTFYDEDSDSE